MNRRVRLPSLRGIQAFETAGRHMTFVAAAREFCVTPSAVSQQVKSLEAELGVALLHRSNRGFELTQAGAAALPSFSAAMRLIAEGVTRIEKTTEQSTLTVNATPTFAATWLLPRLARLKAALPEIEIRLVTNADESIVGAASGADVAIVCGNGDFPNLEFERLTGEEIFPVCSPSFLEVHGPIDQPMNLLDKPLLQIDWSGEARDWPDWRLWFSSAGIEGSPTSYASRFSHLHLALQAAMAGEGAVLACRSIVADDLEAGRLVQICDLKVPTAYAFYVVYRSETEQSPVVRRFLTWLRGATGQDILNR